MTNADSLTTGTDGVYNPLKSIPILVTGESSPTKIRSGSISSVSTELEDDAIFRKRWKSTYGFILACIHLSLGLGNVWRFPYIAYRHGGGSFVVAYLITTVIIIIPLFFLETSLGQFSSRGPLSVWVISPGFKGIGYAMVIISTLASMYFNMINSLSVLYTFASLQERLPWEYCNNWWNTPDCVSIRFVRAINSNISMDTFERSVLSASSLSRREMLKRHKQFYYYYNQTPAVSSFVNRRGFLYECVPSFLPAFNRTSIAISMNANGTERNTSLFSLFSSNQRNFIIPKQYIEAIIHELSAPPSGSKKEFIKSRQNLTNLLIKLSNLSSTDLNGTNISEILNTQTPSPTPLPVTVSDRRNLFDPRYVVKFSDDESESIFANYSDNPILSTEEYLNVFLGQSIAPSISLSWQMTLGSLFIWLIVFAVLIKGHKFSGKVAYIACLYPYVLFIVVLIRVQSLLGSNPGMKKFFIPDKRILTAEVWHDALIQAFFSNFVGWGPIIMMASHNPFFNNLFRDSIIVPCVNTVAAIMVGVISFAMVSYISLNTCVPFDEIAPKDPSFIYVIYPAMMSTFPISPLWGFFIFATITQLGINSQLLCVKTLITSIVDEKIPHFNKPLRIIFVTSFVLFLVGLVFATKIGIYLIEFIDFETTAWSLLTIALLECVITSWIYGANHLLLDIRIILRHVLRPVWYMAWSYVTPIVLIIITISSILDNRDIIMPYPSGFQRSRWITAVAWLLSILPLCVIAAYFAYYFCVRVKPSLFNKVSTLADDGKVNNHNNTSTFPNHERSNICQKFCCCYARSWNWKSFWKCPCLSCFKVTTSNPVETDKVDPNSPAHKEGTARFRHSSGVEQILATNKYQSSLAIRSKGKLWPTSNDLQQRNEGDGNELAGNHNNLDLKVKFKTQPNQYLQDKKSSKASRLFFNKARNRLELKSQSSSPILTLTLKERFLKCIEASPEWGPYTENHQVLQQIAFRIQRSNHQILNRAVHRKAREIIDIVNASGSTNLSIKDLLFINPNAASVNNGQTNLQAAQSNKIKPPRKYSLFDGYKEVVFMELPKDLMTKIDEPGVYTFLQPLDIDVPSNMILLPAITENAIQNEKSKIDGSNRGRIQRSVSRDFIPDFPVLNTSSSDDINLGPQLYYGPSEEGFLPNKKKRTSSESITAHQTLFPTHSNQEYMNKNLWNKLKIATKLIQPQSALIYDPSKLDIELRNGPLGDAQGNDTQNISTERRRRGSQTVEAKYLEADYPLKQFVFGRSVQDTDHKSILFNTPGEPTFFQQHQLRKLSRPSLNYNDTFLQQQQPYISSNPLTHTKSIYPAPNSNVDPAYLKRRKSTFIFGPSPSLMLGNKKSLPHIPSTFALENTSDCLDKGPNTSASVSNGRLLTIKDDPLEYKIVEEPEVYDQETSNI